MAINSPAKPIFIRRQAANPNAGLNVRSITHVSKKTGDIGLEVECEGNKFPKAHGNQINSGDERYIPAQWDYHHDGSLRGEDNAEYVLRRPIKFDDVPGAVKALWSMFSEYGTVLEESNRTSVHVHLNVQEWHLDRLCSFVAMYFALEEILTEWCGEHRVGNLFCLRGKDARGTVSAFKDFFRRDGLGCRFPSGLHYAGLNPGALQKFGSIEVRSLRGTTDPDTILDWVEILRRLYDLSGEFNYPTDVMTGFSGQGPLAWMENILGPKFNTVISGVGWNTEQIRESLYEGIRLAQDLCYCRDWSKYERKEIASNPFGQEEFMSPSQAGIILSTTSDGPYISSAVSAPQTFDYDEDEDYPDPDYDFEMEDTDFDDE